MPAVTTDLAIEQGTTWTHGWSVTYNGTPIDDTWTARSQIRATAASKDLLHEFAPAVTAEGAVVLGIDPATSSAWTWRSGIYDVEVTKGDVTLRVARGRVDVSPEVTRDVV